MEIGEKVEAASGTPGVLTSKPSASSTTPADEFSMLLHQACQGSAQAAELLIDRYHGPVLRVVRSRLARRLRRRVESADVLQSVWASVFARPQVLARFRTEDELLMFLMVMTRNKVADVYRKHQFSEKRDIRRERPLRDLSAEDVRGVTNPTPSQYAVAEEQLQAIMRDQSPDDRQILVSRLGGEQISEIASRLGTSDRTVKRKLHRLILKTVQLEKQVNPGSSETVEVGNRPGATREHGPKSCPD